MKLEEVISAIESEKKNISLLDHDLAACKVRLEIFKSTMDSVSNGGMNTRKIAEKVEQEQERMVEIESKLNESRAKLSAYDDLIKILPKQEAFKLRDGTEIASIEKYIRSVGHQVALDAIVEHVVKPGDDAIKKKKSLRGTLRAYVREDKVFCDGNAPDTYALIEFKRLDDQKNQN